MSAPWLSVVIPVLGDAAALGNLLAQLGTLDPPPAEIVVVDGARDAVVSELCRRHGTRYCATGASRGRQLRQGAAEACGEALWFLHADAELPPRATAAIAEALAGGAAGGHFRFRFAGPPALRKTVLAAFINLRARIGVPYGDQGLFATRSAYDAAGGFADTALFEEVPLVRGLRRAGRFVTLPAAIGVSPRRWERDGWLRRTLENRLLALAYAAGASPERLARRYRARMDALVPPAAGGGD